MSRAMQEWEKWDYQDKVFIYIMKKKKRLKNPNYNGKSPRCLVHNSNTHIKSNWRFYADQTPEERVELLKLKMGLFVLLEDRASAI